MNDNKLLKMLDTSTSVCCHVVQFSMLYIMGISSMILTFLKIIEHYSFTLDDDV